MDQIEKFLRKIDKKLALKLMLVLLDIKAGSAQQYDLKKMKGFANLYRIRVGKIRIIFEKLDGGSKVIYIEYRGKAYKNL